MTSRWAAFAPGEEGGDQVQQRDAIQLRTVTDGWEGGRTEEGNMEISR